MQAVLESNIGSVEVSCPWCIHKHPFEVDLIVSEAKIAEIFYKIKAAYERVLYLQNWDADRIANETKLQYSPAFARPYQKKPLFGKKKEPSAILSECPGDSCSCSSEDDGGHYLA